MTGPGSGVSGPVIESLLDVPDHSRGDDEAGGNHEPGPSLKSRPSHRDTERLGDGLTRVRLVSQAATPEIVTPRTPTSR